MRYITIPLILLILIIFFLFITTDIETFDDVENKSWSGNWNELDFQARENANCEPIEKKFVNFGNISSWIWTVPDSCEQGLPHTRYKDVIAMPEGYYGNYDKTIEHEKIHLYQRTYPKEWLRFYKNYWYYDIYTTPPKFMPQELIQKRRSNPDTGIEPWCCWKNRWWSVPIYRSNSFSLSAAPIVWYDQQENKILESPPHEWIKFFGNNIALCISAI